MRTYPLSELLNLTRAELLALCREISDALAHLPEDAPERFDGRATTAEHPVDTRPPGTGNRIGAVRTTVCGAAADCAVAPSGRGAGDRMVLPSEPLSVEEHYPGATGNGAVVQE